MSFSAARNYLQRAMPNVASKFWDRFGGRGASILQTPMLINLFSTLSAEFLTGENLTKSLIYQQAIDEWISRQWERGTLQLFEPNAYRRAPPELWKNLAYRMGREGTNSLTREQAIEALDQIKKNKPSW